ncbi:MAG: hypothetical protein L0H96_08795 [Humibacillus sp.]|nr:hypothetical protein [Humibacillus sp.]MDN5776993.1 hypothetical protein [Humibacillus sp.]
MWSTGQPGFLAPSVFAVEGSAGRGLDVVPARMRLRERHPVAVVVSVTPPWWA